jgi:membrane protein YqaA with SNARE-associated domain
MRCAYPSGKRTGVAYKSARLYVSWANNPGCGTGLAAWYELLSILVTSFLLNLIPFASPSNLLIASNAALLVDADPYTVGFLVALGSASAKLIHYVITFFIGGFLSQEQRRRLDCKGLRMRHWSSLALFVVAATPLPDEPVIIPLGLLKYNPAKFYLVLFLGKLSITIVGAFFGRISEGLLASFMSQQLFMIASIILTIAVTVVLLKVDIEELARKILRRRINEAKRNS